MAILQKKEGRRINAYELGTNSDMELVMMFDGKIVKEKGIYLLRSTEALSSGLRGEKAKMGDFFKVDFKENPYPQERSWFFANHVEIERDKNVWEQIPHPVEAWFVGEPMTDALKFLINKKILIINEQDLCCYFKAYWGGYWLTAPIDTAIIFDNIVRINGVVTKVNFNFVIRDEIDHYQRLD